MATTICLAANTLYYNKGGGHMWWHLNWALGFKANGCKVLWLEKVVVDPGSSIEELKEYVRILKLRLAEFGLTDGLVLYCSSDEKIPKDVLEECLSLDAAFNSDVFFNLRYDLPVELVQQFRRSALLDLDPGLLQIFLADGTMRLAPHHLYFTIGETVGLPSAKFPDGGVKWNYTAPCVALDWWLPQTGAESAPFTTISHWHSEEWVAGEDGNYYSNDKRDGFLPFLDLPKHTTEKLELALCLNGDLEEEKLLVEKGWSVRESWEVTNTPEAYQKYIQSSKGEFSCAKPHYVRLQTAWISDRTLCYLASGKPAVVQHTGSSSFLPDDAGLFRFHHLNDAIRYFEQIAVDYQKHCVLARSVAEEYFDAKKVTANVLQKVVL
jgi:hypothetical protein